MWSFQAPVFRRQTLQVIRFSPLRQSQLSKSLLPQQLQRCLSHSCSPLVANTRRRANHTIATSKLADQSSSKQGHRTPPPPSRSSSIPSADHFRHNNSANAPLLLSSSPSAKIASQRSAQIARHLSSSAPVSIDQKLHRPSDSSGTMAYSVRKVAAPNTLEHRVYVEKDGVPVSPFHDIPLYADQEKGILNMIVEIPRWTNAKLEVRLLWLPTVYGHDLTDTRFAY